MPCGANKTDNVSLDCTLQPGIQGKAAYIFVPDEFALTFAAGVLTIAQQPSGTAIFGKVAGVDDSVEAGSTRVKEAMRNPYWTHTAKIIEFTRAAADMVAVYAADSRFAVAVQDMAGDWYAVGVGGNGTTARSTGMQLLDEFNFVDNGGGITLNFASPDGKGEISGVVKLFAGFEAFAEANLAA